MSEEDQDSLMPEKRRASKWLLAGSLLVMLSAAAVALLAD